MSDRPNLTARCYARADRTFRALIAALSTLHEGIWLGLAGRTTLHGATELYYRRAAKYLDREYNLAGLHDWEDDAVRRHFGLCRSVLVGAAGGGREAFALERLGFTVGAFDCVETLVVAANALAAAEALTVRVTLAAADTVPEGLPTFDAAVMGWGGYMHIPGRATRVAFLGKLRAHLGPVAPVLLSFFARSPSARRFRYVRAIASVVRRIRLLPEAVEIGDALAGSFDHHFTREELASELDAGGFDLVEYAAEPYGHAVARARPS